MTPAVAACYSLANDLADLAASGDLGPTDVGPAEIEGVPLHRGEEVRVRWRCGSRLVVVALHPHYRTLACYDFTRVWWSPLNRHGVDTLRNALAWMCGEISHPEAR